ncbi:MAG: alanine racemase, partial [Clostridia bacterium]|nr:alanine racemase [Clostridia bacterium]
YNFPNTLPILNIKARVVAINHIKKGDYIGYTNQNKATKDITTATLSIGYADGLPRLWAKRGYCIINGKKCPIVGNICMNMTIVLVDKNVKVNDYATIIGKDGDLELTATEIAKQCKTIEYEILTNFKKI